MEERVYLADLKDMTEEQIVEHIVQDYEDTKEDVEQYDILVAYESVGSWGCDSSSFFLLRKKTTGTYYVVHGSHCSCYGFEGQFTPEQTTIEYLKSNHFSMSTGGYDDDSASNEDAVKSYLQRL